jgi:HSP20 family protein
MRTRTYNQMIQDFSNWADTMNRVLSGVTAPYDYEGNGGSEQAGNGPSQRLAAPAPATIRLPLDIRQENEAFIVNAYLPGIDPEQVEITWENDELFIQGEMPAPAGEGEWLRRELFHGRFERRVGFTVPVDVENIQADFHNGLLTLTLPKAETVRPRQIKVQAR